MTTKITYFNAKVNNTEDYGTHINMEIGMRLEEEQSVQYLLTVTKHGCQIEEYWRKRNDLHEDARDV
jgi:hypothetical protein